MKNTMLASLGFLLLITPLAATAQQFDDFTYTSDGLAITITGYTGPGGAVTIPSTIAGLPVTTIGDFAFNPNPNLTTVTIPGSVIRIGNSAFKNCDKLTSVVIPDSVICIGNSAFYNCTNLINVTIPGSVICTYPAFEFAFYNCTSLTNVTILNGVTTIGNGAFDYCSSLSSVTIPASVTNIGTFVFYHCTSLMEITVDAANASYSSADGVLFNKSLTTLIQCPGGKSGNYQISGSVTRIGDEAFDFCTNLINVTIPGSVTNIGFAAFFLCRSLVGVTIKNGVTSIGDSAFAHCKSLTDVTIPVSVTSFGGGPFFDCPKLAAITVDAANPSYSSADGVLFNKSLTTLIQCPGGKTGSYSIPASVNNIGAAAFTGCNSVTEVTIPGSVTNLGYQAFGSCSNLTNVTILGNVTSILNYSFSRCTSLKGVFFKGNAPNIGGSSVFEGANNAIVYYLPGTTGWGTTIAGRPASLWNPLIQTGAPGFGVGSGGFGFDITGTTNIPIVVEATKNLANGAWVPLQSLNLTNGFFHFNDPEWIGHPARMYRIRSP